MNDFETNNVSEDDHLVSWIPYKTLIEFICGTSNGLTKSHLKSSLLEKKLCCFVCQKVGKVFDALSTVTKATL